MKALKIITICLIASISLAGYASAQTSPKGLEVPIESAAVKFVSDVKDGGYKIVDTAGLKKWFDEGKKITIISTLPASDDKALGKLPSALNAMIPRTEQELAPADKDNLLKVAGSDKEKTIVIYCGFVGCRRSHIGAKILVDAGFKDVYRYPAGIIGWKELGYPVEK
jgi:thiosulfate/3-mercaptopyruvate sulfurtransferase